MLTVALNLGNGDFVLRYQGAIKISTSGNWSFDTSSEPQEDLMAEEIALAEEDAVETESSWKETKDGESEADHRGSQLLIDGKVVTTDTGGNSQGSVSLEVTSSTLFFG